MTLQAKWSKLLDVEILQRSSQALSVVDNKVYVFGGELRPREPRDNVVHVVSLDGQGVFSTRGVCSLLTSNPFCRGYPQFNPLSIRCTLSSSRNSNYNSERKHIPLLRPWRGSNGSC
jgi:hypothetical protein